VLEENDPSVLHSRSLKIAEGISEPLLKALILSGPSSFPERENAGLVRFLARAVVGQQLSTKAARSIWSKVEISAFSSGLGIPEIFSGNSFDVLKTCGVSGNKIKALRHLYDANTAGFLCGETICQLDHKERSLRLLSIWGIGQWTCDMVSIFYFRCPDVWPEGDVTVQKTFGRLIGKRKPLRAASKFGPFRSYLALSMWKIADSAPNR